MNLRIRPATDDERDGVIRSQWFDKVLPRRRDVDTLGLACGRPGTFLSLGLARRAFALLVDDLLASSSVLVAELDGVAGELLGWVVYDGHVVHYVAVPGDYRRSGVATALLALTGAGPLMEGGWSTRPWRALVERLGSSTNPLNGLSV